MKIFLVAIGIAAIIAVVISISFLTIPNNQLHCTFCPEQHMSNQLQQTGMTTSPHITTVIIPPDSEDLSSGKNYEPNIVIVVLGVNNTVHWINEAIVGNTIEADNHDDPNFWNATYFPNGGIIKQGKSFNFTFTQVGEFGYHGTPHPWLRGQVLVLPQSGENLTKTILLNDTKIPGPCEIFSLPCPINHSFTAQKFGPDVYIEKITTNGVDRHVVVHPFGLCVYPSDGTHETCKNPDDLTILGLDGINTSISHENATEKFNTTSQEPGTLPVMYQNMTYMQDSIKYNITGDNYVRSATLDNKSDAIILSTYATEDGNLTVTLTPDLLNLIEKGTPFIVLTDGHEVKYKEYLYNQNMIMTIPFHSGTKEIEIITTEVV